MDGCTTASGARRSITSSGFTSSFLRDQFSARVGDGRTGFGRFCALHETLAILDEDRSVIDVRFAVERDTRRRSDGEYRVE